MIAILLQFVKYYIMSNFLSKNVDWFNLEFKVIVIYFL